MNLEIVYKDPADLIAHERNSRTHSKEQIAKIVLAIKEYGFLNPVIVNGENVIIAGHARIEAAKIAGLPEVPTIDAGHLTEAQQRAYIIADNRLSEDAGWDQTILREEMAFLRNLGDFDLNLTGFGEDELKKLGATDAYSPVLNPEKGSQAVTGSEVEKAEAHLTGRYAGAGTQELVSITCPHCGEDFEVQKGAV